MAIERFQAFAVYRDTSVMSKKFSIAWFVASWLIAICFVVIMVKAHQLLLLLFSVALHVSLHFITTATGSLVLIVACVNRSGVLACLENFC